MRFPTGQVSITGVGSHEIGSGFNSRRRKPAGFNSIGIRSHVLKAIYYFIPSLVAIVRGITSLMIIGFFLYYNCDLIYLSGYRTTLY